MKRKVLCLALAACLALAMAVPAFAEDITAEKWDVVFDGEKMIESYPESVDLEQNMQPGDSLIQVIDLKNNGSKATNWYITNEVLKSLEDRSKYNAYGGAYTYRLTYDGPDGSRELYNSELVGGNETGLNDATQGLEDYVFLGELPAGGSGAVTLSISLDGMSQINLYQDTDAGVRINFAVEDVSDPTHTTVVTSVKTGDWMQTLPFILLTAVSGLALLGLGVVSLRRGKKR